MNINNEIKDIYEDNWGNLQDDIKYLNCKNYATPFLIKFDEAKLKEADLKVMIFGQETKGWVADSCKLGSVDDIMAVYYRMFCEKKFHKGYGRSSFFKAFRYFEKQLKVAYPEKSIYFSWNNINKIGRSKRKTGVSATARNLEQKTFSVIASEVKIFEPDIVIFLTGPYRDNDIRHHFNDAKFASVSGFKTRALSKVYSDFLPEKTIRIYHPSYYGGYYKVRNTALKLLT